mmetsp:Transcript_3586/g.5192  ORF Transcript_3586/g.5192 Transcript_3586/m.5192 type:complete len:100 (+) Transcript_3586:159-458(+)
MLITRPKLFIYPGSFYRRSSSLISASGSGGFIKLAVFVARLRNEDKLVPPPQQQALEKPLQSRCKFESGRNSGGHVCVYLQELDVLGRCERTSSKTTTS